jgi:hypothetical protein
MTKPVPTPITCQPTNESICSCTHCGTKNYTHYFSDGGAPVYEANGTALFDVRVPHGTTDAHQTSVSTFCADCLKALSDAIFHFRSGV